MPNQTKCVIITTDGRRFAVLPDTLDTAALRVSVAEESDGGAGTGSTGGTGTGSTGYYTSGPTPTGTYSWLSNGLEPDGSAGTFTDSEANLVARLRNMHGAPPNAPISYTPAAGGGSRVLAEYGTAPSLTVRNGDRFSW